MSLYFILFRYTSIGGTWDTLPNEALLLPTGGDHIVDAAKTPRRSYAPAFTLKDNSLERLGRTKQKILDSERGIKYQK